MNNSELENALIVSRRPRKDNEFIYRQSHSIGYVCEMLEYIEKITGITIESIDRDELPLNQGFMGWRVTKNGK